MLAVPDTLEVPVLRTYFSDERAWQAVQAACAVPSPDGFAASLTFVSDPAFGGLPPLQAASLPRGRRRGFLFLVDAVTVTEQEMPIQAVDLRHRPGRSFRVIPSEMWSVENNLSLCNMDFFEFADRTDQDGVFRGFPSGPDRRR